MITLFLDTSTEYLTVALLKNDELLSISRKESSEHSKYAMIEIEKMFNENNVDPKSVNKIMVINGPGSFTGIRIGVTIAKVYAWACNINIVPISTLHAYALSHSLYDYYIPYIDARRGYVYGAIYDKEYKSILNDSYILYDELLDKSNALNNKIFISKSDNNNMLDVKKIYDYYKNDEGVSCHKVLPVYLKKTEAEEKFGDIND